MSSCSVVSYYSINFVPKEVIYRVLHHLGLKGALALQLTSSYFHQMISDEGCPIWENLCRYYFPDTSANLYKPSYKNIVTKQWKILTFHSNRHPRVYLFDINFLASAKRACFFNSQVYAIYETNVSVYNPKKDFSSITIPIPDIEDLVVYGPRLFILKKQSIEIINAITLKLDASFDCVTAIENQTNPLAKVIFIVDQQLLVAACCEGQKSWKIKIWDYEKNEELYSLPLINGQPSALQIKDKFLYVGFENGSIEVVHLKEGLLQVAGTTVAAGAGVDKLSFSGNLLISRSLQSYTELNVWTLKNGLLVNKCTYQVKDARSIRVHDGLIYSLVLGYVSYNIHIYDPKTKSTHFIDTQVSLINNEFPITDFQFHEGMFFFIVHGRRFKVLDYSENASSSCTLL